MKPELAITIVEAADGNVHTALGISDKRAEELGQASIDLMVKEKHILKTMKFISENVENVNELVFFAFSAGKFLGEKAGNPLASLLAHLAGTKEPADTEEQ
jgi:hypothetical protein